ncbi:hypothetical protein MNB_SV-9-298 [hydrothermal vent metagenome]|uniref:Uncharacterized protein n=1 Tax=hydrothermal vent metagenome TaxID=652676 RepID=A0A1W1BAS5_9ZZZZ
MSNIRKELDGQIRKLVRPLKDDELLLSVLKIRLTKKEYKLLINNASNKDLNMNLESYEKLKSKLTKKLNQEKLKQELMI